jgi:hypothetical protein
LVSGTYDICSAGNSNCGPNSINLDVLINQGFIGALPSIPNNPNPSATGYQIILDPLTNAIKVIEDVSLIWQYTDYKYRIRINISNSGATETDYQIPITINTASLIAAGKVKSDCSDLMLTTSTHTPTNFWIEPNTCNTFSTKIWIKDPQIVIGNSFMYMYYGNAQATSTASSPAQVFVREVPQLLGFWDTSIPGSYPGIGDTIYDLSGNGLDFVHSGTPVWTPSDGFYFNNNGDFSGAGAALLPLDSDPKTVIAKANPDPDIGTYAHVFNYGTPAHEKSFGVVWNNGNINSHTNSSTCSVAAWTTGIDNTIAISASGSTQSIYKNGVLLGSCNNYILRINSNNPVSLGDRNGSTQPWKGYVEYVQFYTRVLSAQEILDIYNYKSYATPNYGDMNLLHKYSAGISVVGMGTEEVRN